MKTEPSSKTQLPAPQLSQRWSWGSRQPISFLMQQAVENPDVVSLAAGLVDQQTLPVSETKAAVQEMLADDERAKQTLQYGTTPGAESLRQELLKHLARLEGCSVDGLGIDVDQLILTTGSHQLLSIVCEILLNPGDICLVAAPTYFVFMGTLRGVGARIIPVDTDEDGMQMEALEAKLAELETEGLLDRVKLIYLVSYYENPSGISLADDRRQTVVELARKWSKRNRIFILEDAAYRELHYDGPRLPSIWSYDSNQESVILAQTFSKSFSPGLRVGFGVVPRELVGPICDRKGNEDFGSANFNQHLIATVLKQGQYESHVEELCQTYRQKRDTMLEAADRYFSDLRGVTWIRPHGGLYVWMSLPESINTSFSGELFSQATKIEKVMYVPGDFSFAEDPEERPRNHLRLSFGVQSLEGIEEGMRRLSRAVQAVL